jgi:hypothetical protein
MEYRKYTAMPIKIQTINLIQVLLGKKPIKAPHERIPNIGINGFHGFLKGLGKSGWRKRNTITPTHTMTKLANVPILTVSANSPKGINPATIETMRPHMRMTFVGV